MLVDLICVECSSPFQTEARYLKRGRGKCCSRTCSVTRASNVRWAATETLMASSFWSRVDDSSGPNQCWPWIGRKLPNGYGRLKFRNKYIGANRMAFALSHNSELGEMLVCHRCDNPVCCNPSHLFLGTHQDNMDDMVAKGRKASGDKHWTAIRARIAHSGATKEQERK
jgi:hypothetical protein